MNDLPLVIATIDPATVTSAAPATSDVIDLSLFHDVTFVVNLGNMAAETITATVQKDTASAFSTPTTHLQKALSADASANDNTQLVFRIHAREVNERYIRLHLVTGSTSGGPASAVAIATPRYSGIGELATVTRVAA